MKSKFNCRCRKCWRLSITPLNSVRAHFMQWSCDGRRHVIVYEMGWKWYPCNPYIHYPLFGGYFCCRKCTAHILFCSQKSLSDKLVPAEAVIDLKILPRRSVTFHQNVECALEYHKSLSFIFWDDSRRTVDKVFRFLAPPSARNSRIYLLENFCSHRFICCSILRQNLSRWFLCARACWGPKKLCSWCNFIYPFSLILTSLHASQFLFPLWGIITSILYLQSCWGYPWFFKDQLLFQEIAILRADTKFLLLLQIAFHLVELPTYIIREKITLATWKANDEYVLRLLWPL